MRFWAAKASIRRTARSASAPIKVSPACPLSIRRRRRAAKTVTMMSLISGIAASASSIAARRTRIAVIDVSALLVRSARPPVRKLISPVNCVGPSVALPYRVPETSS